MNKQLSLAIKPNDEAKLEDFNWNTNPLLEQHIKQILTQSEDKYLYLWGPEGSGKSHVLQACCQAVHTDLSAMYFPLCILKEWGPETIEGIEEQNILCIDDIQLIAGQSEWEEALFHLYNRIKDRDRNVLIISGNQPPSNLPIKLADLRSRLSWGLVLQVHELSDEHKINTLQKIASRRGFTLSEGVGQYLINRCSRNMHDLQAVLNKLDDASLSAQRKITIPFVKDTLNI